MNQCAFAVNLPCLCKSVIRFGRGLLTRRQQFVGFGRAWSGRLVGVVGRGWSSSLQVAVFCPCRRSFACWGRTYRTGPSSVWICSGVRPCVLHSLAWHLSDALGHPAWSRWVGFCLGVLGLVHSRFPCRWRSLLPERNRLKYLLQVRPDFHSSKRRHVQPTHQPETFLPHRYSDLIVNSGSVSVGLRTAAR